MAEWKPIETFYNGYKFRSRTEARWAVFFDTLGVRYEYEKEGYDLGGIRYLPDFWLPDEKAWVEIKGQELTDAEIQKAHALTRATRHQVFVFIGAPWFNLARHAFLAYDKDDPEDPVEDYAFYGTDEVDLMSEGLTQKAKERGIGWYAWAWRDWWEGPNKAFISIAFSDRLHLLTHPRVIAAYLAARQARFEFGENG